MKKTIKIICAALLLIAVTGCKAEKKEPSPKPSSKPVSGMNAELPGMELIKTNARVTVTNFYKALHSYDWGEASEYTLDSSYLPRKHWNYKNAREGFENALLAESQALAPYMERFEPFINCVFTKITKAMSFEIQDITLGGSACTCTVRTTELPSDYKTYLSEALSEYSSSAGLSQLTSDFLTAGSVTEREAMDALFDSLVDKVITVAEKAEFKFEKTTHTLTLVYKDGEWYIDTEASKF